MKDFLETITSAKRLRVNARRDSADPAELISSAKAGRSSRKPNLFRESLADRSRINVIAEFKRASPSKGQISDQSDVAQTVRQYDAGGAAATSVLTEEDFFRGTLADFAEARQATSMPILMKDFFIDEFQIHEAAAHGADAILLIVAALEQRQLEEFRVIAEGYGMDALVEVHDEAEIETAGSSGARIIGVNNRNLRSFQVSLDISRSLASMRPADSILIAESGLQSGDDVAELWHIGFDGFLIGEALMRSDSVSAKLSEFMSAALKGETVSKS